MAMVLNVGLHDNRPMASRLLTFVVWALVAVSALFWGLKLFVRAPGLPSGAQAVVAGLPQGGGLTRVLGTVVAAQDDEGDDEGEGRFQLWGIVAPVGAAAHSEGVALMSVDGQPPRPWRAGAVVFGDTVLLSVSKRTVQLGPKGGPASTELTLPDPDTVQRSAPGAAAQPNHPRLVAPLRPMMQDVPVPQAQPGTAPAPAAQDEE